MQRFNKTYMGDIFYYYSKRKYFLMKKCEDTYYVSQ